MDSSKIHGGGGAEGAYDWLCDKCIFTSTKNTISEPECSLCMLHGGPLKQCDEETKKQWAHVTCALCVNGVSFREASTRKSINISAMLYKQEKKSHRKCGYCNSFTKHLQNDQTQTGLTVKCDIEKCNNRFHVTCGQAYARCYFSSSDWPHCVTVLCHEHAEKVKNDIEKRRVISERYTVL